MTFSLTGYDSIPTDGSGRVLITDIYLHSDDSEDALICRSEVTYTSTSGDWFLDPTAISTDVSDRVVYPDTPGWKRIEFRPSTSETLASFYHC